MEEPLKRTAIALLLILGCKTATPPPAPAPNRVENDEVKKMIAGRENEPAEMVFMNIQGMKGVPAARVLAIMNAYTRALGVQCTHCHEGEWDFDSKPAKKTAREMRTMTQKLNADLKALPSLAGREAVVNCTTCHRGQVKPALDMPPTPSPRS
jgi:hypothetical protein